MLFLMYFGAGLALLIVGTFLFELTTKNKEFQLIWEGNIASMLSLGGKVLGLAIGLSSVSKYSVSLMDMLFWGAVGIVAQIVAYWIAEWTTKTFAKRDVYQAIEDNKVSVGGLLMILSVSIGLVIAGCMSY